jgi:hypothetical protein
MCCIENKTLSVRVYKNDNSSQHAIANGSSVLKLFLESEDGDWVRVTVDQQDEIAHVRLARDARVWGHPQL